VPQQELPRCLLIVDDDAVDRRRYERLLKSQAGDRCQVVQAADGQSGLALLRAQRFDCVVLDLNLPDMGGMEFLAQAFVDGALPCGFVLVTGQGSEAIAVEAMKQGAQDYLTKDKLNENSLWRAVTGAIRQTELRQRLQGAMRSLTETNATLELEVATRKAAEACSVTAREAAEQASRAKSRFLAGMSHELRTPLNGILGYARLLRIEGGLNSLQAVRVEAMLSAGTHLLEMIHCVLDLSEIESGHAERQTADVEPRRVGNACLDLVRPAAEAKALALALIVAPDVPHHVLTEPTRLRQVLLNLLGNAVKFTMSGSVTLRLSVAPAGPTLRFEVVDTGPGIRSDQRHRLFQDFERLGDAVTRAQEGAGLGLSLSTQLAALMGGRMGHEDNPDGAGSVFWLELPLLAAASEPRTVPATHAGTQAGRPLNVLAVDDVAINLDIASAFLRLDGHHVTCVGGGAEAVAAVAAGDFDVVLMDVRMPRVDGLEATRRIRALPGSRGRVPVVALTAQAFTEQVAACRAAGMGDHLLKPFDPDALRAVVLQAAARRPAAAADPLVEPPPKDGPPAIDMAAFQRTAGFLSPEAIDGHLRSIDDRVCVLLRDLRAEDSLILNAAALGEAAHSLAGSAGMFGFMRVADVGRRFEHAAEAGAADLPSIAADLIAALEAAHSAILSRLPMAVAM
jgi:signal transduction histidine kinase